MDRAFYGRDRNELTAVVRRDAANGQSARKCSETLPVVMGPQLDRLAGFAGQYFRRRNLNGVERPDVYGKRGFGAIDDSAVHRGEIQHADNVRKLFALVRDLAVVQVAQQALAVNGSEGLDFQEFGRYGTVVG